MITQALCTSFKAELLLAVHDFRVTGGDTFKVALYTSDAAIDANTTAYTPAGEVVGANYIAGGATLTRLGVSAYNTNTSSGVGFSDFADITFSNVSITARGALIYNATPSALSNTGAALTNPAVCVLDFGSDKVSVGSDFTIVFPAATFNTAIVRVS